MGGTLLTIQVNSPMDSCDKSNSKGKPSATTKC